MKRITALFAAFLICTACSAVFAMYDVIDKGIWPQSWPKELDPLRKQARTLEGPMTAHRHYEIPFTKRAEFEFAWPHFLAVKTKGAPIILVRGPKTDFFKVQPAGVVIHTPPINTDKRVNPEVPLNSTSLRERWMWTSYIELAVDGDIVDLNRIPLPADTPIIDERFKDAKDK